MTVKRVATKRASVAVGAIAMLTLGAAIAETSCTTTTTAVQVRTFERAQRVDVVCMRVLGDDGFPTPPTPALEQNCAPVAAGQTGALLPYHLFAVVTQSLRGELAVVDLTAGVVVDVSSTSPGVNFLPVGQLPTDVAAAPDGRMVFVGSAEVGKSAIYAIPSVDLIGDSQRLSIADYEKAGRLDAGPLLMPVAPSIAAWPACLLPQAPSSVTVMTRGSGGDAGVAAADYQVVALLPGSATDSAKLVTIDPAAFADGRIGPGSLTPCPISNIIELGDQVPPSWVAGPTWPNGLPYVDGGVDLSAPLADDAGARLPSGLGCDGGDAGARDLRRTPGTHAHGSSLAVAGTTLYVGDDALPIIHVIDASNPAAMRELAPLVVSSALEPARVVTVKSIAISPTTRDYKRFLYAIDRDGGGLIVYDVTDPATSPRSPLSKPNAEINPFQPPDRILFNTPIAAISFVRHDFPFTAAGATTALTGALCTPNPSAGADDPGLNYRASASGVAALLGPARLRGVFAMATLTNGQVATIDVDDWDAPCRRPSYLDAKPRGNVSTAGVQTDGYGDLAIAQVSGAGPYEAPAAIDASGIDQSTGEWFFPVSQPHRARSAYLLRKDATAGVHVPNVLGTPQLYVSNALASSNTKDAVLRPARDTRYQDPFKPGGVDAASGVRLSFDDPEVHVDQDWSVVFEGLIPGFDGIAATLSGTDYSTLTLGVPTGNVCRRGVEDARVGSQRFEAITAEDPTALPAGSAARLGDYVQLVDEVLASTDPYWSLPNSCWDGIENVSTAAQRASVCAQYFGPAAQFSPARDLPVLEAYDDHLVVGQFAYRDPKSPNPQGHSIAPAANSKVMRLAQCCFHNQAHFKVRAGGEWVASGSVTGYLSHVVADAATGACALSCERRETLLSSRMVEVLGTDVTRNSARALRNPFFSAWMKVSAVPSASKPEEAALYTFSERDAAWKFSARGGFVPQTVNLASTTLAVLPQSMRFIESLGQMAVVDGASQGLILIDLSTVAIGHTPYF